jgi:hypothetical protein
LNLLPPTTAMALPEIFAIDDVLLPVSIAQS